MIGAPGDPRSPLVVGDRYQIIRTLGSGAQSTVFLAHDRTAGAWRALKMASIGSDLALLARFHREARLVASLSHPNIVRIVAVTTIACSPTLVMELARGGSLSGWLRRNGPLPAAWAIDVALQCASALEHAHARGILHRDVKPANVLLQADGSISLADFGIARCEADATALTAEGALLGTLAYMSPEQRNGGRVDARADVYALGAMVYTVASARRETELFLCLERPSMLAGVDPAVARVVRRCCRYDPADRVSSMAELRDLLSTARPTAPPARRQPLGGDALEVPVQAPFRTEHDFHVHQLRLHVALARHHDDRGAARAPSSLDTTEEFERPTTDPGAVPTSEGAFLPVPDRPSPTAPVAVPTVVAAPSRPRARPSSVPFLAAPRPSGLSAVGLVLVCATAASLVHARSRTVTAARTELVAAVEQERALVQHLSALQADGLADDWRALEDTHGHEAAARIAERIVTERHRLPEDAAGRALRVYAALEAWRKAEAGAPGCGAMPPAGGSRRDPRGPS